MSVDGALGHEALMLLQHLADKLSNGWGKSYGHVLMRIRVRLLYERPTFASVGHMCVGKVQPVLMMELASPMSHWTRFTFDFRILILFWWGLK